MIFNVKPFYYCYIKVYLVTFCHRTYYKYVSYLPSLQPPFPSSYNRHQYRVTLQYVPNKIKGKTSFRLHYNPVDVPPRPGPHTVCPRPIRYRIVIFILVILVPPGTTGPRSTPRVSVRGTNCLPSSVHS